MRVKSIDFLRSLPEAASTDYSIQKIIGTDVTCHFIESMIGALVVVTIKVATRYCSSRVATLIVTTTSAPIIDSIKWHVTSVPIIFWIL
jgi:hypothetical protein